MARLNDFGTASTDDVAALFAVDPGTVKSWIGEGMPSVLDASRKRVYDLARCVAWIRTRDARIFQGRLDERDGPDEGASKNRKLAAAARMAELDLAEREGELVDARDVEDQWRQSVVSIRESVMSVPSIAVQAGLIPTEREAELEAMCRDVLIAIAGKAK